MLEQCYRQLPLPPGPWVLPIIGDTLRIMRTGLIDLSQERQRKYGPIHRTWLIGQRNVFVSDAACVRRILNGEHTIVEGTSIHRIASCTISQEWFSNELANASCRQHSSKTSMHMHRSAQLTKKLHLDLFWVHCASKSLYQLVNVKFYNTAVLVGMTATVHACFSCKVSDA